MSRGLSTTGRSPASGCRNAQAGFTLVELAIVILILGLVLGGLVMPLAAQRENARFRDAAEQMDAVQSAIEGFALVNGRLPCPAIPSSNGSESTGGGNCSAQHGFVPATTLNIDGARNGDNLLLDPWGSPLRYSVSDSDADSDGQWDFTTPGEMRDVSLATLAPDLVVCSTAAGASATACGNANATLTDQAPALVLSLGKDWNGFTSADQLENAGANLSGGPSGATYAVPSNVVFVSRARSDQPGGEFDDSVRFLSPNGLYRAMITAGRLP